MDKLKTEIVVDNHSLDEAIEKAKRLSLLLDEIKAKITELRKELRV